MRAVVLVKFVPAPQGTPTMGGLLLVAVVMVLALLLDAVDASTYAVLLALLGVSLVGAFDDWLNARTGNGISARQKLAWQIVVATIAAIYLQQHFAFSSLVVPFVGEVGIAPILWIAVAVVAIVSTSNGVNLTDGLDGLSGGTMTFAWISYMVIALLNAPGQVNLAIVCALIAGALVGFLWFNVHPASVIIGDAGALGFGAALAVTGLVTGHVLLLPLKPDGCVHKHFNKHPGQSAVWMAWIYSPYMDELGKWTEQKEVSPDFK